jgi:hypothetical protein
MTGYEGIHGFCIARFALVTLVLTWGLFTALAGARPIVIYDQMTGVPGTLVASEQSIVATTNDCLRPFFSPIDAQDCIAADDFTVPPGPAWSVTGIQVDGQGGAGDRFKFELFKNVGGLPLSPSSASLGVGEGLGPKSGSGDVAFKSKWGRGLGVLPPGDYWLGFYADGLANESSATSWYWQSQSPQAGREAAWLKMCGETTERWSYLSACGQTGPDLRFRLEGERMTRGFGRFQLGRSQPKPNGGLTIYGTFPGPGELKLAGVGKGGKVMIEAKKKTVTESTPVPLQINPTPDAKKALKEGRTLKARVAISFVRRAGVGGKRAPAYTRTIAVVLDER